jgi:hypothetical protein
MELSINARQIIMLNCPRLKWEIVGGNKNAIGKVTVNRPFGGLSYPEHNHTMAINANPFITHHKLLACWSGINPRGKNELIAMGNQTALLLSNSTSML